MGSSTKKSLLQFITLPKIADDCYLSYIEYPKFIDFPIKRIYYITQPKTGLPRGSHAHKETKQVLFCLQGSVKMVLTDGIKREETVLNQSEVGLVLDKMVWHDMEDMTKETILLVVASKEFDPNDYIRDYDEFKRLTNG